MTSLGNRVFADVIKFKMMSYWIRVGPGPMTVSLEEGNLDTERRESCVKTETRREEHSVRVWRQRWSDGCV